MLEPISQLKNALSNLIVLHEKKLRNEGMCYVGEKTKLQAEKTINDYKEAIKTLNDKYNPA